MKIYSPGIKRAITLRQVDTLQLEGLGPDPEHRWRHDNISRLLIFALHFFDAQALERMRAGGHSTFKHIYFQLFRHLDYSGTRIVDLSRRAGVTKAAMGQLVREVGRLGYVRIAAHPTDRRAKMVRLTPKGRRVLEAIRRHVMQLEDDFRKILGPGRYKSLRADLLFLRSSLSVRTGD